MRMRPSMVAAGTLCLILIQALLQPSRVNALSYPCAPGARDDDSSLPSSPTFPDAVHATGLPPTSEFVQNHWSEVAVMERPAFTTPSASASRVNCPHLAGGLVNWHDAAAWQGAGVPAGGSPVTLPPNTKMLVSSCSVDPSVVFGIITIPATSSLIFADGTINFRAKGFDVQGKLQAGSKTCRLRNALTITLHGSRSAQPNPSPTTTKGISVNGQIDLHGNEFVPTWTRLARTALPGDDLVYVQDLVNWQAGQTIVLTTSELKDSRDFNRNDEATILWVKRVPAVGARVSAVKLAAPLQFKHYAGAEYQSEVALLSRSIRVQGDEVGSEPTDVSNPVTCQYSGGSPYPCPNKYMNGFGGHIIVQGAAAEGRFSGVNLYRMGQTNELGRYALHFHLGRAKTAETAYISDCSVQRSFFRCFAIHGTDGALVTKNTAYDVQGHCYFIEDGVEEGNTFSYNFGGLIHPMGPYYKMTDNYDSQNLGWDDESPSMILPSDIGAAVFYITNAHNTFLGNAASGGWAGFAFPGLRLPVKNHNNAETYWWSPRDRPLIQFKGNTAHSTGYWWGSSGGLYIGGQLEHKNLQPGNVLTYTAGRSGERRTCAVKIAHYDWCSKENERWMIFEDVKVWLSSKGIQNWGDRAEYHRLEFHDVNLAANVFGEVFINGMLTNSRSQHVPTWFSGCTAAGTQYNPNVPWNACAARDAAFWSGMRGFQFYDVGQAHILNNVEFRNVNEAWPYCVFGCPTSVFFLLTHSDQFVPEAMQMTKNVKYTSVSKLWAFSTRTTDTQGITVSGRLQNWVDVDGSAVAGTPSTPKLMGSTWAGQGWWKLRPTCTATLNEMFVCQKEPRDTVASVLLFHDAMLPDWDRRVCVNGKWGGARVPCPLIGRVMHFGKGDSTALPLGQEAKITGPVIVDNGGWFVRFLAGTPRTLSVGRQQIHPDATLLLALSYPPNTRFSINWIAPSWCSTAWATCQHAVKPAASLAQVASSFGDYYFFHKKKRTLYLRLVQRPDETYGPPNAPWTPFTKLTPNEAGDFTRGGMTLMRHAWDIRLRIVATNCGGKGTKCKKMLKAPIPPKYFVAA